MRIFQIFFSSEAFFVANPSNSLSIKKGNLRNHFVPPPVPRFPAFLRDYSRNPGRGSCETILWGWEAEAHRWYKPPVHDREVWWAFGEHDEHTRILPFGVLNGWCLGCLARSLRVRTAIRGMWALQISSHLRSVSESCANTSNELSWDMVGIIDAPKEIRFFRPKN